MANDIAGRPWVLDTPGGGVIVKGWIRVKNLEFVGYTVDADTATITDQNGRSVADFNGRADLSPVFTTDLEWIQGINLVTLTAGKIRVYIR